MRIAILATRSNTMGNQLVCNRETSHCVLLLHRYSELSFDSLEIGKTYKERRLNLFLYDNHEDFINEKMRYYCFEDLHI